MKSRIAVSVLAAVLILTLCVGVFVACDPTTPETPKSYTLSFDIGYDGGENPQSLTVEEGKTATLPAAPEREGYKFDGWYLGGEGDALEGSATVTVTADATYVAKWTIKQLTASFDLDNYKGKAIAPITVDYDGKVTLPTPEYDAAHIKFLGWVIYGSTTLHDAGSQVTMHQNALFIAKWAPIDRTGEQILVKFIDSDGKVMGYSIIATHDSTLGDGILADPEVEGKMFQGWYVYENGAITEQSLGKYTSVGYEDDYSQIIIPDGTYELTVQAKYFELGQKASKVDDAYIGTYYSTDTSFIITADSITYRAYYRMGPASFVATLDDIYVTEGGLNVICTEVTEDDEPRLYMFKITLAEQGGGIGAFDYDYEQTFDYDKLPDFGEEATVDKSYQGAWSCDGGYSLYTLRIAPQSITFVESGVWSDVSYELIAYANSDGGYYLVGDSGTTYTIFQIKLEEGILSCDMGDGEPLEFTSNTPERPTTDPDNILVTFIDYDEIVLGYGVIVGSGSTLGDLMIASPSIAGKAFLGWFVFADGEMTDQELGKYITVGYEDDFAQIVIPDGSHDLTVQAKYLDLGELADEIDEAYYGTFNGPDSSFIISSRSIIYRDSTGTYTASLYGDNIYLTDGGIYAVCISDKDDNQYVFKLTLPAEGGLVAYDVAYPDQALNYELLKDYGSEATIDETYYGIWSKTVEGSSWFVPTFVYTLRISKLGVTYTESSWDERSFELTAYANSDGGYILVGDTGVNFVEYKIKHAEGKLSLDMGDDEPLELELNEVEKPTTEEGNILITFIDYDGLVLYYAVLESHDSTIFSFNMPEQPAISGKAFLGWYVLENGVMTSQELYAGASVGYEDDYSAVIIPDGATEFTVQAKYLDLGEAIEEIDDEYLGTYYTYDSKFVVTATSITYYDYEMNPSVARVYSGIYIADYGYYLIMTNEDDDVTLFQVFFEGGKLYVEYVDDDSDPFAYELWTGYGDEVELEDSYCGIWTFTYEIPYMGDISFSLMLSKDAASLKEERNTTELQIYANPDGGYILVADLGYTYNVIKISLAKENDVDTMSATFYNPAEGKDMTAKATNPTEPITVQFLDADGEIIKTALMSTTGTELRSEITFPDAPEVEGKLFLGWYQVVNNEITDKKVLLGDYLGYSDVEGTVIIKEGEALVLQMKYLTYGEASKPTAEFVGTYYYTNSRGALQRVLKITTLGIDYYNQTSTYFTKINNAIFSDGDGGYIAKFTPDAANGKEVVLHIVRGQEGNLTVTTLTADTPSDDSFIKINYGEEVELSAEYQGKWTGSSGSSIFATSHTFTVADDGTATYVQTIDRTSSTTTFEVQVYANGNDGYYIVCDGGNANNFFIYTISLSEGSIVIKDSSGNDVVTLTKQAEAAPAE